ncbi:MAG TPA: methionine--tRNA ligase [Thermoplasmata archaeon]
MDVAGHPMDRIFIGVAWPYANAAISIGGLAGVYLPADAFARYHRLRGHEVLMVSGSDVHGTPILVSAEKEGPTPDQVSRQYHRRNAEALERLGVSFDLFTDTHTLVHEKTVHELFLTLLENGYIGRRTDENPYCPKHARFLPDRYVEGTCPFCGSTSARGDECDRCGRVLEPRQLASPHCRLCGTPAEFRPSEHFFLLLDKLEPKIRAHVESRTEWRPNVAGTTKNFLAEGLHPTSITRDLDWGVPIPLEGYGSKRFYVWFDAVIGYLSATREWAIRSGHPEAWRRFWSPGEPVRSYYFIGKDNIFFHTVIWPAILLGHGGLRLPDDVPANEWLQVHGRKISKSGPTDGDLFLPSFLESYPPDVVRFYAALLAPQNHDTEFSWDEFHQVSEDVLSNQYGNLVQRILVLARDRCGGRVPTPPAGWSEDTPGGVGERIRIAHAAIESEFDRVHLKEALELALAQVREANRRVHDAHPWNAPDAERDRTLYEGLWVVKAAATWLAPFLPFSSAEVYRMLGASTAPGAGDWANALSPPLPGSPLGEIRPLFPRRGTTPPTTAPAPSETGGPPSAPVGGLDVRVGVVQTVENHPSADRLYVLTVDVGEPTPRTIVAGVRPQYAPEALRDRTIAVLANLEPRTIRKIASQGMLLAAEADGKIVLLVPPDGAPPGTPLLAVDAASAPIPYARFEAMPILVARVLGSDGAGGSRVDLGGREATVPGTFAVGTSLLVRLGAADAVRGEVLSDPKYGPVTTLSELPPGTRVR